MKKQTFLALAKAVPNEIQEILGQPPVLTSENADAYWGTIACFAKDVEAKDIVTWFLIKDLADFQLEIARFRRLKEGVLRSTHQSTVQMSILSLKSELTQTISKLHESADKAWSEAAKSISDATQGELEKAKIYQELADAKQKAARENAAAIAELQNPQIDEKNVARLTTVWFENYNKLEENIERMQRRFMKTLREIEHRRLFGTSLRENLNKIIEGEILNRDDAAPKPATPRKALRPTAA